MLQERSPDSQGSCYSRRLRYLGEAALSFMLALETARVSAVAANPIPDWPPRGSCQTNLMSVPPCESLARLKLEVE
jgi:hypothetical protein